MACELRIFISDDAERMCELLGINMQSFVVDALQAEIHTRATVRACTQFGDPENTRVF